jgi:ribosomal protein L16/L10AE
MINLSLKPKKTSFTPSKKKKLPKRTLVQGKPLHLILPRGRNLNWRSSYNIILRTTGYGEVSEASLKAFRKALYNKRLRRLFTFRAAPFLEITKKPNEVRMGKGHGTKISKRIFPFIPGQVLLEVNLTRKIRLTPYAFKAMSTASKKFPFRTIISKMDI